jgi:putative endonuclease
MASVYILLSKKLNRRDGYRDYTGSCKDLSYRIEQHLNKDFSDSFTAKTDDWELFLFIDDLHYDQARRIEEHIKKDEKQSLYSKFEEAFWNHSETHCQICLAEVVAPMAINSRQSNSLCNIL